jgi:hypothetical protein
MGFLATRELDAKFGELICADTQWLRSEFNALMSAAFGVPPAWPGRPAPPHVPPPAGRARESRAPLAPRATQVPGGYIRSRQAGPVQRSPPPC